MKLSQSSLCKQFIMLCLVVFVATGFLSAGGVKETAAKVETGFEFTDSRGQRLVLESAPERIVSLSPNLTETLFALGLQDALVGRTDYCDYPQGAASIPSMGDLFTPSIEKIVAVDPDVVILSTLGHEQTITALEQAGLHVAYLNESETMEGTFRLIQSVGRLTGKRSQAEALIAQMQATIATVENTIATRARPRVYYVAGFGQWGDFTATGDTFIHDIINLAGGENIASDATNWSFQLELLLERDPDIIILPPSWGSTFEETKQQFVTAEAYRNLSAVKTGNIYPFDNGMIERQGPRSAQAVLELALLLHPSIQREAFK